jgi:hypothetical protein
MLMSTAAAADTRIGDSGVPAVQVAERARRSVDVLLRIYAKRLDGTQDAARRRIESALNDVASLKPDEGSGENGAVS